MRRLGHPIGSIALDSGPASYSLTASVGTLALSGQSAALRAARKLTAACGIFALTGQSASFQESVSMTASAGSFAMTGQATTFRVSRLAADNGAHSLVGQSVGLRISRRLTAANGAHSLAGQAVNFASAITYATIVDGVVTSIDEGTLPDSDADTLYVAIAEGEAEVGWYFSEICQTFSPAPPVIAPGEIAPPYPPGSTPPVPGDEDYPEGPEDAGPPPLAALAAGILSFHADKETPLTIAACPSASTEIDPKLRTWFDLSDVCEICMQARVETELEGAKVTLKYRDADDNWVALSRGRTGPFVLCEGDDEYGDFRNVHPDALGRVLLSPFVSGGDDASDLVLGNVQAFFYYKKDDGACSEILEGCSVFAGLAAEDFSAFDADAEWQTFQLAENGTEPTLYYQNADPSYTELDLVNTFNGNPTLEITDPESVSLRAKIPTNAPGDLTYGVRFNVDGVIASSATAGGFTTGYVLIAFGQGGSNFLTLAIQDTDRLVLVNQYATPFPAVVDIGSALTLFGSNRELIMRCCDLGTGFTRVSVYLQDACAEPALLHEDDYDQNGSPYVDYDEVHRFAVDNFMTDTVTGTIRILQEAIHTDSSVFGL